MSTVFINNDNFELIKSVIIQNIQENYNLDISKSDDLDDIIGDVMLNANNHLELLNFNNNLTNREKIMIFNKHVLSETNKYVNKFLDSKQINKNNINSARIIRPNSNDLNKKEHKDTITDDNNFNPHDNNTSYQFPYNKKKVKYIERPESFINNNNNDNVMLQYEKLNNKRQNKNIKPNIDFPLESIKEENLNKSVALQKLEELNKKRNSSLKPYENDNDNDYDNYLNFQNELNKINKQEAMNKQPANVLDQHLFLKKQPIKETFQIQTNENNLFKTQDNLINERSQVDIELQSRNYEDSKKIYEDFKMKKQSIPELTVPNDYRENYQISIPKKVIEKHTLTFSSADRNWGGSWTETRLSEDPTLPDYFKFTYKFNPNNQNDNKYSYNITFGNKETDFNFVLKDIVSVKLNNINFPEPNKIDANNTYFSNMLDQPFLILDIPEIKNNSIHINGYRHSIFSKLYNPKIYDTDEYNNSYRLLNYKNKDNNITHFKQSPLSSLPNLSINIKRPNGSLFANYTSVTSITEIVLMKRNINYAYFQSSSPATPTANTLTSNNKKNANYSDYVLKISFNESHLFKNDDIVQFKNIRFYKKNTTEEHTTEEHIQLIESVSTWLNRNEGHKIIKYYNNEDSSIPLSTPYYLIKIDNTTKTMFTNKIKEDTTTPDSSSNFYIINSMTNKNGISIIEQIHYTLNTTVEPINSSPHTYKEPDTGVGIGLAINKSIQHTITLDIETLVPKTTVLDNEINP